MKMKREFNGAKMNMDEMDMVVGGLAYFYRRDMGNGTYGVVVSTTELNAAQANAVFNAKINMKEDPTETYARAAGINLLKGLSIKVSKGCRKEFYQRYKEKTSKDFGGFGGEAAF